LRRQLLEQNHLGPVWKKSELKKRKKNHFGSGPFSSLMGHLLLSRPYPPLPLYVSYRTPFVPSPPCGYKRVGRRRRPNFFPELLYPRQNLLKGPHVALNLLSALRWSELPFPNRNRSRRRLPSPPVVIASIYRCLTSPFTPSCLRTSPSPPLTTVPACHWGNATTSSRFPPSLDATLVRWPSGRFSMHVVSPTPPSSCCRGQDYRWAAALSAPATPLRRLHARWPLARVPCIVLAWAGPTVI
jgi:hypothetical protein